MQHRRFIFSALVLIFLAAGTAAWAWLASSEPKITAIERSSAIEWQWENYARKVLLPQTEIVLSPERVVGLMNEHAPRAFRGRPLHFILWQPGDALPKGFTLKSALPDHHEEDRKNDEARQKPEWFEFNPDTFAGGGIPGLDPIPSTLDEESSALVKPDKPAPQIMPNTLAEQTTNYLQTYEYRIHLQDKTVFIFRKDVFQPRFADRDLYLLAPSQISGLLGGSSPSSSGETDLLPALSLYQTNFLPGSRAIYRSSGEVVHLLLEEESLEQIRMMFFGAGCTGIVTADSRLDKYRQQVNWSYLRNRGEFARTKVGIWLALSPY